MQRMAAMRTMSLCGILAIKPRIKASKTPKLQVPQARDRSTCVRDYHIIFDMRDNVLTHSTTIFAKPKTTKNA